VANYVTEIILLFFAVFLLIQMIERNAR